MKTREILIMVLFIIAVCIISLIPFSNVLSEGLEGATTTPVRGATTTPVRGATTTPVRGATTTPRNTISGNTTVPKSTTTGNTTPASTTPASTLPKTIKTNADYLNAVISALSSSPENAKDKLAIYNIQSLVSSLNTQNSATLLGEIGNPNNLSDPRLFLHYMNWFGSNCPIDTDTCKGLTC